MPSFLNNAPALFVLEALCLTILCRGLRLSFFLSVVLSELVVLAQIFLAEERWSVRRVLFVLCLCNCCALGCFYVTSRLDVREMLPQSVSADFLVMESRRWGETRLLLLKDERGSKWITVAKGLLTGAEEGDRFHLHASTRSLREESQRSNFSPFRYWKARGVRGELRDVRDIRMLPKLFSIHTIRQSLRLRIQTLPFICRALTAAVLLGDRDPSISEDFRRWGISHYLAVSGWHVSFAIVLAAIVLNKTRFRFILASLFLWTYCCISGMSASAVRASIMLQVSLFGAACGIGSSGLNSVGLAGVIMLLHNPWVCYDLGWQLSVLAAATAIILQRFKSSWSSLLTSPLMWLIASPLVAPNAGGIFISSLPINAMATALFSFVLLFTVLCSVPLLTGIGLVFPATCAEQLFRVWAQAADQWVRWIPLALPVNFFPVWLCGGLFFMLLALSMKISLWRTVIFALTGSFMLYLLCV